MQHEPITLDPDEMPDNEIVLPPFDHVEDLLELADEIRTILPFIGRSASSILGQKVGIVPKGIIRAYREAKSHCFRGELVLSEIILSKDRRRFSLQWSVTSTIETEYERGFCS